MADYCGDLNLQIVLLMVLESYVMAEVHTVQQDLSSLLFRLRIDNLTTVGDKIKFPLPTQKVVLKSLQSR